MFSFPESDVDFYLPQLVSMYIQMEDVAEVLHHYLLHRYVVYVSSCRISLSRSYCWILYFQVQTIRRLFVKMFLAVKSVQLRCASDI